VQAAFAKADGGVEGGEAAKADVEWRDGSTGAEFAVLLFEDGDEGGGGCGLWLGGARFSRETGFEWGRAGGGKLVLREERGSCGRGEELQKLAQR
jgi:hypothetical protein